MRLLFTYLACVFLGGISVNASAQNKVIFEDDFNKSKKFEKTGMTILLKKKLVK